MNMVYFTDGAVSHTCGYAGYICGEIKGEKIDLEYGYYNIRIVQKIDSNFSEACAIYLALYDIFTNTNITANTYSIYTDSIVVLNTIFNTITDSTNLFQIQCKNIQLLLFEIGKVSVVNFYKIKSHCPKTEIQKQHFLKYNNIRISSFHAFQLTKGNNIIDSLVNGGVITANNVFNTTPFTIEIN